ncbi:MAG: hypothetical protein FJZ00_11005 [Candidatus Sericytochromatia bacterium]|uniref:Uncharacterized protein n=1 Tax=Candidatus Tanganyikabacteria bacterium TaxID=2961651 RepID=A0A938BNS1_9BACT|nr:hypothetical protein [Candidatus Tanganyikabacteria bacterium]
MKGETKPTLPLFDETFDQMNQADGERFLRLIQELKVRVAEEGVSHGILLHKWLDATHMRVLVYPGTPGGKLAAEMQLDEGFVEGPFLGHSSQPEVSDVVEKARSATARLEMPDTPNP